MIPINYVTGPVGSGKTYSAMIDIAAHPTIKYLYVCPSTLLCDQISNDLRSLNNRLRVKTIYQDDRHDATVTARITAHFKAAGDRGEVLIITHAAFDRIRFFQSRARWHVIYDEAPQVIWYEPIKLAQHPDLILNLLDRPKSISASYSAVEDNTDGGESDLMISDHTGDSVCALLRPISSKLISPDWTVYVGSEQFEAFSLNRNDRGQGDHRLDAFALLQPTIFNGFASVTIMAAHFETTLAYLYWSNLGTVNFQPHPTIKPRSMTVPNGHRISVYYLIDGTFSKNLGRKALPEIGASVSATMEATAIDFIGDRPHVVLRNKDYSPWYEDGAATELPHSSHGLNTFQHIDVAWVHAALNPPPAVFSFLQEIAGIEAPQVHTAIAHHAMLQAVGRCSIRDYTRDVERTIIVPDKATAEFIAAALDAKTCSPLSQIDLTPTGKKSGRPQIHASHAAQLESIKQAGIDSSLRDIIELNQGLNHAISGETKPLYNKGNRLSHFGTVFAHIRSADAATEVECNSQSAFVDLLRDYANAPIAAKEERPLISPAKFQPIDGVKEKRGLANVVSASGLWLDNDGGDLTPQQFAGIFPHTEMYIWSTFSSTLSKPRWRVYIPTSLRTGVVSYKALMAEITRKLERRGYFSDPSKTKRSTPVFKSGFDRSKLKPCDLFYLPSKNAARPEAAFFLEFNGDARTTLNPLDWIKHSSPKIEIEPARKARETISDTPEIIMPLGDDRKSRLVRQLTKNRAIIVAEDEERGETQTQRREQAIGEAEKRWQNAAPGTGSSSFFKLAASYHRAGLDAWEAEGRLNEQSYYARSKSDRRGDIKGIIKRLWR